MKKYMVGGAVRDGLLHLPIKERDWVVVGATSQDMLIQGYKQVGKNFPVFLHPKSHEEYALARTERKVSHGYTGFVCYASPEVTLEEDLRRRDLTINAIARDDDGNLIDPYQGQQDICHRWLRHISDAFSEDPLRVLRVARFAACFAHLNFRIAPETLVLMKQMVTELSLLAPERVWKETERALVTSNPMVYFQILRNCGALKVLFPEVDALFSVPSPVKWDLEIDAGSHALMVLSISAWLTDDVAVRFAAFCHNLVKVLTSYEVWSSHYSHGPTGVKLIEDMCQRLKVPNLLRDLAKVVANTHDLIYNVYNLTPKMLIKLLDTVDAWRKPVRLEQIILASEAVAYGRIGFGYHHDYSQGNFLRNVFRVASSVNACDVIMAGFSGVHISEELNLRRQQLIASWKLRQI